MKKVHLVVLLLFTGLNSFSAIKTWNGGAGGNWNNSSNWLPTGVPVAGDDIIFNSSASVTIDLGLSPVSLNSLHFINNSGVIFELNETSNFRLFSTSTVNPALLIEAGCTFTFNAANSGTNNSTLDLTVATGCIGIISGTLNISNTGSATSGPKLNTDYISATNYGVVTVTSGGVISIFSNAGNTISAETPVSTFNMLAGSTYENRKNGGSFPFGTWAATSLARALSPGTTGPTFNGTSYGNLEWNCPSQTTASFFSQSVSFNNVNLISTNAGSANGEFRIRTGASAGIYTMTVNGNLNVSSGARLVTTSNTVTVFNGGVLSVKGNITNSGTIAGNGINGTINNFQISGTSPQFFTNISGGTLSGSNLLFTMQNSSGLTLVTPVTLPGNADFLSGKINTTSSTVLTMVDDAVTTNSSASSFVEGPMRKIGNDNFVFPVGVGSIYAPIGIVNVSGEASSDVFTAEYKRTNPQSVHGAVVQATMNHVSYVEYWTLTQNTGGATKQISLVVTPTSFCKVLNSTYVSRWNGSLWTTEGSTNGGITIVAPFETGTITSVNNLSSFGDFSLITDLSFAINPLPVKLLNFDVRKTNDVKSVINWELAECCSAKARFEIQKSNSSNNFTSIAQVPGSETDRFYNVKDDQLGTGVVYYRLKIIEEDGKVSYSRTIAVSNSVKGLLITSIAPNPVHSQAIINISSAKQTKTSFQVYNLSGHLVKQWQANLSEGANSIDINVAELPAGIYHLIVSGSEGKTIFRFGKQ